MTMKQFQIFDIYGDQNKYYKYNTIFFGMH